MGPSRDAPTLTLVAGAAGEDTIDARPVGALVIGVEGVLGTPAVDVRLDLTTTNMSAAAAGGWFQDSLSVRTDHRGLATVQLRYGVRGGAGRITVRVPDADLADTARYTVRPGRAVSLDLQPADSAVELGSFWPGSVRVMDRHGNPSEESVRLALEGPLEMREDRVLATGVGRGIVRAEIRDRDPAAGLRDSATVTVVPPGELVAVPRGRALHRMDLTGRMEPMSSRRAVYPSWAPDGASVVTVGERDRRDLWITDLEGGEVALGLRGLDDVRWPVFSSDGSWIYFEAVDPAVSGRPGIHRVRPDGTGRERVTPPSVNAQEPGISPDGRQLAYRRQGTLVVQDMETGNSRDLFTGVFFAGPTWAPTGDWIAYVGTQRDGGLWLLRSDGTERHRVGESTPSYLYGLAWSPDASRILVFNRAALLVDLESGSELPLPWGEFAELELGVDWRP